jgi:hypothetical protein
MAGNRIVKSPAKPVSTSSFYNLGNWFCAYYLAFRSNQVFDAERWFTWTLSYIEDSVARGDRWVRG